MGKDGKLNENETEKPRGLYLRGGSWVINKRVRGVRIYKSLGPVDAATALNCYHDEIARRLGIEHKSAWATSVDAMTEDQRSWLHRTLARLHIRGKASGKGCSLTTSEMRSILLESGGRCQVLGIPFSDDKPEGARIAPFQASIDRIDSKQGYHYSNCRVVCLSVNLAMRDWGEAVMLRIAKAMLYQHLREEIEESRAVRDFWPRQTKKNGLALLELTR